jgi:hypothetical protein
MPFPDYVALHWPCPGQPAWRPGIGQYPAVRPDVWGATPGSVRVPDAADRGAARVPGEISGVPGFNSGLQTRSF